MVELETYPIGTLVFVERYDNYFYSVGDEICINLVMFYAAISVKLPGEEVIYE